MRSGHSLFTFHVIVSTRYLSQSDRIIFTFIHNSVFGMAFSPSVMEGICLSGQERDMKLIQHQISYEYYVETTYREKKSFLKMLSGIGTVLPGKWWNHHPRKCSKRVWIWHLGTWFSSELDGTKLIVGLDLGGLSQPK